MCWAASQCRRCLYDRLALNLPGWEACHVLSVAFSFGALSMSSNTPSQDPFAARAGCVGVSEEAGCFARPDAISPRSRPRLESERAIQGPACSRIDWRRE